MQILAALIVLVLAGEREQVVTERWVWTLEGAE